MLEAESWGLVDVVHQAARGGHHDVSQAAEAVCSEEQNDSAKGPMPTPQHHREPAGWVQIATSYSLRSPQPHRTYVFWTRLSCSLTSDFCPVIKATRRGVASV